MSEVGDQKPDKQSLPDTYVICRAQYESFVDGECDIEVTQLAKHDKGGDGWTQNAGD